MMQPWKTDTGDGRRETGDEGPGPGCVLGCSGLSSLVSRPAFVAASIPNENPSLDDPANHFAKGRTSLESHIAGIRSSGSAIAARTTRAMKEVRRVAPMTARACSSPVPYATPEGH